MFIVPIVVAALALGGCAGPHDGARAKPTATRYLAPSGVDHGACTQQLPCRTFNYAYRAARPGERVDVAAGNYPPQAIGPDASKTAGSRVVFRAGERARPSVGGVTVSGSHVEFRGMTTHGWTTSPSARDVVFRDVRVLGGITVVGSYKIAMIGGSVGPGRNYGPEIQAGQRRVPPRKILIDGVTFHDWIRTNPALHVDCLHVLAVDGLVVRNSRFRNCEAFDLLFTQFGAAGWPRNVLVENNSFDCCRSGFFSVFLGGEALPPAPPALYRNFLIRFNSADTALGVNAGVTNSRSRVRFDSNVAPGNLGPDVCFAPGVTWTRNVFTTGLRCNSSNLLSGNVFLNPKKLDFRLRPGSAAVDEGNPDAYPRRDLLGRRRPAGRAPDAGAYESW